MSMIQELITSVAAAERQLDDQIGKLTAYKQQLAEVSGRVDAALAGSSQDYVMRMTLQLTTTQNQIDQTIAALQGAKQKLQQVRMI